MNFEMIFLLVFGLSVLTRTQSNTVTSPQIRILDVATKASETRLIPHSVDYRNPFPPHIRPQNRFHQNPGPLKSYVIYDDYPFKIFKEWKTTPTDFPVRTPQSYLQFSRQPNGDFPTEFFGQDVLPPPKPTLAYRSVYSNIIKVFGDSLDDLDRNRFENEKYIKSHGSDLWKYQPVDYGSVDKRQLYHNQNLPENFPNVFSPNTQFHFSSFDERSPQLPQYFYPREGFYNTHTINYDKEVEGNPEEVEILPQNALSQKTKKKPFLCSLIRVNQRQFPESGVPCGRSDDDFPITLPEYPDYSNLPNHKIPVEHRRQHYHMKRIKRSGSNDTKESRTKRDVGYELEYGGWSSPLSYEGGGYDGYFSDNYRGNRGFGSNSRYYRNRNRSQNYRNSYITGSRYDEYDDDDQNDDSNSRGLSGYLTNGGRRYKSRKNNDDEDEDDDNSDNDRDNDSDEEMERMNRRDNDRRNNEDSRDRRRNNNDDDEYRDNRRNNNRGNSRRNNGNRRYNNDRYDSSSNRNRYYSNSNGYGSSYGGYGGGGYGSGGYGSGGYGSGGYGSYGNNGGYGYGGYGNGFSSF